MTYPAFKATGSRWVPRVPDHWSWIRAKNFLLEVDDRSATGQEELLSMRQHRGLVPHKDVSAKRIDARHLVGYKKARPDELVLNRMQAGNAMFFRNGLFGLVSPDYAVFRLLRDDNPTYLGYLFRSRPMCGLFRSESKGLGTGTSGFLRLYSDRFAALPIPLPSRSEQDQIVAYLHAQDAHIARLVKAKHSALSLLADTRSALADEAIQSDKTRNIRLDRLLRLVSTPIRRMPNESYTAIGLKNRGRGIFHKPLNLGRDLGDSIFFPLEEGDFVSVAVAAAADHGCVASHRYPIAKCDPKLVTPEYLYTFFLSGMGDLFLNHHSRGAAGRNRPLNPRTLLKEAIPVPPLNLQLAVSDVYRDELKVKREIEKELALIRELRERQIADVVTGQIDVRSWRPGPEDLSAEEDLPALGDDDDNDTTEEDTDGDDGHD